MSKAKPVILAVIGVLLLTFVVYNVEIGLYYFQYPDQLVHYKMEITELIAGNCDKAQINADLAAHGSNSCLSPLGTYQVIDILVAGIGFSASLYSPILALKQAGKLKISPGWSKNLSRFRLLLGIGMVSVAMLDALGMLTAEGQPLDWSTIVGVPVPPFLVEIALLLLGIMVIKKAAGKLKSKKSSDFPQSWQAGGAQGFRGSLEKNKGGGARKSGVMTVGDLRSALSLDQYEDIFQLGTSEGDEIKVGRTCHYCNGQGCGQCDYKGEFM